MEKRKEADEAQRPGRGAVSHGEHDTGSCEEQEKVDACDFSPDDDQGSYGRNASSSVDERHGDEGKVDVSLLTSAVDALDLGASRKSNPELDPDPTQETKEEDRLEGAVGGSRDLGFAAKAAVSNDEKAPVLHDSANPEGADDDDGDKDDNGEEKVEKEEMKTCFSCGHKKQKMQKCGGCRHATYCNRNCQKEDWKRRHKTSCGNYKRFLDQVNDKEMIMHKFRHGPADVAMSMGLFKRPFEAFLESALYLQPIRRKLFVLLEIVDKHPHLFRPGCIVQDVHGNRTQILFYMDEPFVIVGFIPIRLEVFLRPGQFIWLVDPVWHNFLDGTVGIRIDHREEFEIPGIV